MGALRRSAGPTTGGRTGGGSRSRPRLTRRGTRGADPIRHVVVLMLENRSFDHLLGALSGVDGIDPSHVNRDPKTPQIVYRQKPTRDRTMDPDPPHALEDVLQQLDFDGRCGGFVFNFRTAYPWTTPAQRAQVMAYYDRGFLPALHALAESFAVCEGWFSSVPGPTWPNRFFVHSGTSKGRVHMPVGLFRPRLHDYDQTTLYDRLNQRDVAWRIYRGDIPQSLLLAHLRLPWNAARYRTMDQFFDKVAGPATDFPAYAFIEPEYFGGDQNDDHPPSDTMQAQRLLGSVYNAIRANEQLWEQCLLLVVYDEHGGFYDHVYPPRAVPPDDHEEEFHFRRLGLRVPAVLVSPWVRRTVVPTRFDHTSLLRYLIDKHGLGPLGRRAAAANSFAPELLRLKRPRSDVPDRLDVPRAIRLRRTGPRQREDLNENQRALLAFAQWLETQVVEPTARARARKLGRLERYPLGIPEATAAARETVDAYLRQQTGRAQRTSRARGAASTRRPRRRP